MDSNEALKLKKLNINQDTPEKPHQNSTMPKVSSRESVFVTGGSQTIPAKMVNIKCKNLKGYEVIYSMIRDQDTPALSLMGEPTKLIGGANLPQGLFRNPEIEKAKDHNKYKQKNFMSIVHSDDSDLPSSTNKEKEETYEEHLVNEILSKLNKGPALLGYKSLHYEHMRAYILSQEIEGNCIKMPKNNSKFAVVLKKRLSAGDKEEFWVYDIFKRTVVRKFGAVVHDWPDDIL